MRFFSKSRMTLGITLFALAAMLLSVFGLTFASRVGAQAPIIYPEASGVTVFTELPVSERPDSPALGGVNVTVTNAGNAQNETTVSINPTAANNLIAGANDYSGGPVTCGVYRSSDTGATWSVATFPYQAGFGNAGDPGVAHDANGNAYYLCMEFNRGANDATQFVRKSTDNGATWGPPILAAGAIRNAFDDKGHIAVDTSMSAFRGNVYVSLSRLTAPVGIRFNRSTDGGVTFTGCPAACADFAISDSNPGNLQGSNIAVGAGGTIYVGWADWDGTNARIRIDRSTDGGLTFGVDRTVATFAPIGNPGGPGVRPLSRVNSFPVIGTHPTNDNIVYAVWPQNPASADDSDIHFARSTDGGITWSASVRVNSEINPVGDFNSQFFPWMSVDPTDGEINIVWYDDRTDPNHTDGTPLVDLFFASSTDGGLTFGTNLRVSTQSSNPYANFGSATPFFGDYNAIDSLGGVAFPVWSDSRTGDQDVLTTQVGGIDLSITKTDTPDPAIAGQPLRYDFTVSNAGPASAFNVTVTDVLPVGVTYQSNTGGCAFAAGTLTCNLGSLAPTASTSFSVQVLVNANLFGLSGSASLTNTATVTGDQTDSNLTNNSATATTIVNESADLSVFKDCKPDRPSTVAPGVEAICTITIQNLGPSVARNVSLTDAHFSNGIFNFRTITPGACSALGPNPQNMSGTVFCSLGNLGTLSSGSSITIKVGVSATEPQDINDTATVYSDTPDPNPANNHASDGVTVAAGSNLAITKTDSPDPVVAGTNLTYDLSVTNLGPSIAANVVVRDNLPAGVTVVSVSAPGGTCNAGVPGNAAQPTICNFDSLAVSATKTMQIVVTVLPGTTGILHNDATVSSDMFDPDNSNNLATADTTVTPQADLSITKTDNPDPVVAGQKLTYEVTITNNGPSVARTVTLSDSLPAEVTFTSATITNGSGTCVLQNVPPNTLFCNLNDLNPGAYVKVFIETLVKASVLQGSSIVNGATAGSVTFDPNLSNNTAAASTAVNAVADIMITKGARADYTNPSPRVVYTIVVTNLGTSDAQGVVMTDPLPLTAKKLPFLFYTGYGPAAGQCFYTLATHKFTCNFGLLAAGDSRTVDIWLDARGSSGVFTNIASASTTTTDPILTNNSARKDVKVKGGPGPR